MITVTYLNNLKSTTTHTFETLRQFEQWSNVEEGASMPRYGMPEIRDITILSISGLSGALLAEAAKAQALVSGTTYDDLIDAIEEPVINAVMQDERHNQAATAKRLGLNRGTLRKKLKKYGLL